jgi:hypothetical protein
VIVVPFSTATVILLGLSGGGAFFFGLAAWAAFVFCVVVAAGLPPLPPLSLTRCEMP